MNLTVRNPNLMSLHEIAEYLQVSERTVRRLIDAGKLTAFKVGRQWRFQKKEVDRIAFCNLMEICKDH
jgi:excisionase family DNA binding protein